MENRKFTIGYGGIEWDICEKNWEYHDKKSDNNINNLNRIDDNGKISYIFGILPVFDEDRSYKKLNEICDFEVLASGHKFTGSFIDALEYIKANFKG
ncbi:hypothetical protein GZ989_007055 [Campylobacter fetus]|uniref:Uncharacterized protein n=2 Tax=Campylobacter fetus TaxID=196 RepID=A0A825BG72_CAMFE|nr:hypothetical protein [Campylobacter fetus]OCS32519.1 hypothetical protein AWR31_09765 [Campylobacter fetus subsp. venerealis]EAI8860030.1 hypothetical protein [Campylobacter fetus]EAJ5705208.1 hypothetical protein [Campylobacter fetus]KAA3687892.1 hypothetical protein E3U42_02420 [Campylobacter fetus subsp. fetus]OCS22588.1 hypothetical protein CFVI9825_09655 [Campylobacter fetus subsp. venerealis cfvi9825]